MRDPWDDTETPDAADLERFAWDESVRLGRCSVCGALIQSLSTLLDHYDWKHQHG